MQPNLSIDDKNDEVGEEWVPNIKFDSNKLKWNDHDSSLDDDIERAIESTLSNGRAGPGPAHFCWPLTRPLQGWASLNGQSVSLRAIWSGRHMFPSTPGKCQFT